MSLHFTIDFGQITKSEFYGNKDPEALDNEFKRQVVQQLNENITVEKCYSAVESSAYVVFQAKFSKSNSELYDKFGSDGLSEAIQTVAKNVYKSNKDPVSSTMERWH